MLYKYCTTKGFDILLNSRLKAATFKSFNDPFELCLGCDLKNGIITIQQEYDDKPNIVNFWKKILDDQNIQYDTNSPQDIIAKFAEFQINDFKRVINDIRNTWKNEMGIICLSESFDSIQMWAHYAENHHGIVVGFDMDELVEDKQTIVKVEYNNEMISLPITGIPEKLDKCVEGNLLDMLKRKETNWAYEKEVRLYVELQEKDNDGNYYIKILPSCIKSIYLGLRSEEMSNFIAASFKQKQEFKHLKLYQMKKHDSAFRLIPAEISI